MNRVGEKERDKLRIKKTGCTEVSSDKKEFDLREASYV